MAAVSQAFLFWDLSKKMELYPDDCEWNFQQIYLSGHCKAHHNIKLARAKVVGKAGKVLLKELVKADC